MSEDSSLVFQTTFVYGVYQSGTTSLEVKSGQWPTEKAFRESLQGWNNQAMDLLYFEACESAETKP